MDKPLSEQLAGLVAAWRATQICSRESERARVEIVRFVIPNESAIVELMRDGERWKAEARRLHRVYEHAGDQTGVYPFCQSCAAIDAAKGDA